MPENAGLFLDMPECARMYLNLLVWLLFDISSFVYLIYNHFSNWARVYLFKHLQQTGVYSLTEHEATFFKRQKLIFFYCNCKYFICKFAVTFWGRGGQRGNGGGSGSYETWYTLLVFFQTLLRNYLILCL